MDNLYRNLVLDATRHRSPLKWAGGKYNLLDQILPHLPQGRRFIEPFVGGGSVFLNTDYPEYIIGDTNNDLMSFYRWVRDTPFFIGRCEQYFKDELNTKEWFYQKRINFNTLAIESHDRAAIFLYLNRHCFNGLCRYNKRGNFNVPFGNMKKPYFPKPELNYLRNKLKLSKASICNWDYQMLMSQAGSGYVIYCDPPYVPLSDTANFTAYTKDGFDGHDQMRLVEYAIMARDEGAFVAISNHDTPYARQLYREANTIHSFLARRSISCKGKERKPVQELLAIYDGSKS